VILNFDRGTFGDSPAQSRRTLGDLAEIFEGEVGNPEQVVYETFGCPGEVEGPPRLLFATTVIQPGDVEGEFFMTRGHFHTNSERGELMFTLKGAGALLLMDREGKTWAEEMELGSTHDIDGKHAHRVVNTGGEPLIFLVAWMSDCGHDYDSIKKSGFGKRLRKA
jgi:glucose-6-phosphate isomerase, archaeal